MDWFLYDNGLRHERVNQAKFQKTEFDKYATSGVIAFIITSIYLIQFTIDPNWHSNC